MIKIKQPKIISVNNDYSRLSCDISVDGEDRNVWFEVEKEYEKYLCYERSDAFLIGILSWAMRLNHDIECDAPVTDELLYNIEEYLIPSLTKYAKSLHRIKIKADIAPILKTAGKVGTGCSCGVDSFHSILNNIDSKYSFCKLTHLCLNNVGSFSNQYVEDGLIESRRKAGLKIAKELGLKAVITNSNFADAFQQDHLRTHVYSSVFAIYCLQHLWGTYLYSSSGYDFSIFNLKDNDIHSASYTELLLLNCFSHRNLRIYSEGGAKMRLEKTAFIADSKLAQENLHVCLSYIKNCGKCLKCIRTMNSLYALSKLDKFSKVFDIDYYKKHKDFYMEDLYRLHLDNDPMTAPEYELLKHKIPLKIKKKYLNLPEKKENIKNNVFMCKLKQTIFCITKGIF